MGDKSPKAKDKAAHDAKQAPSAPTLGKGKGR